jgi:protocatechuate 3,4-dioxygenase beta subunit
MTQIAWLGRGGRWVLLGLIVAASLGTAVGMLMGGPAFASGESGGSPGETGTSPTGTSGCPSSNPPNEVTLVAGTPQTAILQTAFASALQVALTNSDGCPVTSAAAGVPVTFSAPSSGASGVFSTSGSDTVTVGADVSGTVAAPPFTANDTQGSYTVTASSRYGSVSFSLTNTAAGVPARIVAIPLKSRSASVTGRYPEPLQVEVLDSGGNPVAGATVTFTLASGASGACGTNASLSASASFAGGGAQATATTGANGVASSPLLIANSAAGSFTATAAVSGKEPSGGSGKENSGASGSGAAAPVSFSLANLAGKPTKLATGVGSTQSTTTGTTFPIRLAVTVTDAQKNPVPDAQITFSAPAHGAGGDFTVHARGSRHHRGRVSHPYTVKVKTSACGIAVAPAFTTNDLPGGYIVKATVKHARPAAFALVNEAPGQSS